MAADSSLIDWMIYNTRRWGFNQFSKDLRSISSSRRKPLPVTSCVGMFSFDSGSDWQTSKRGYLQLFVRLMLSRAFA